MAAGSKATYGDSGAGVPRMVSNSFKGSVRTGSTSGSKSMGTPAVTTFKGGKVKTGSHKV